MPAAGIVLIGLVVFVWMVYIAGVVLFRTIGLKSGRANDEKAYALLQKRGLSGAKEWHDALDWQQKRVTSYDGIQLYGEYLPCAGAKRTMVFVHGYKGTGKMGLLLAKEYYADGFNVLLIDQRQHGRSGGKQMGFGLYERNDVAAWVDMLIGQDPEVEIVLQGESMGAATVLQYLGAYSINDALPDHIKAAVADCAYTNAYYALLRASKHWMHLPQRLFFRPILAFNTLLNGYDYREIDTAALTKEIEIPVMFIHGEQDGLFPVSMSQELYEAKKLGAKELHIIPDAGHGRSFCTHPETYMEYVRAFLRKHINWNGKRD